MKINELTKVQPSKTVIPALAKKLVQGHKEGYESAVEIATKLDFISKVCMAAKEDIKENIIQEIKEGNASKNGYSLKVAEAGVKYDYSNCNDPVLKEYEKTMAELKAMIDTRQKFLKALPYGGMIITDEDTGEHCKIYPPVKTSTESPQF